MKLFLLLILLSSCAQYRIATRKTVTIDECRSVCIVNGMDVHSVNEKRNSCYCRPL